MNIGPLRLDQLARAFAKAALIASVANAALAFAGRIISHPPATFGPYAYSSVVGLTLLGALAAAAGYAAARWYIRDAEAADRWYLAAALLLLLVSFYPDLAMPWSTDADQAGWTYGIIANLMLMHVVALAPILYFFNRKRLGAAPLPAAG